jgi:hypothetical protein
MARKLEIYGFNEKALIGHHVDDCILPSTVTYVLILDIMGSTDVGL